MNNAHGVHRNETRWGGRAHSRVSTSEGGNLPALISVVRIYVRIGLVQLGHALAFRSKQLKTVHESALRDRVDLPNKFRQPTGRNS